MNYYVKRNLRAMLGYLLFMPFNVVLICYIACHLDNDMNFFHPIIGYSILLLPSWLIRGVCLRICAGKEWHKIEVAGILGAFFSHYAILALILNSIYHLIHDRKEASNGTR